MMEVTFCKNCGSEVIHVTVKWLYDQKYCDECHHCEEFYKTFYFCSLKCAKDFLEVLDGHKCEHNLYESSSTELNGKKYMIKKCKICEAEYSYGDGKLISSSYVKDAGLVNENGKEKSENQK